MPWHRASHFMNISRFGQNLTTNLGFSSSAFLIITGTLFFRNFIYCNQISNQQKNPNETKQDFFSYYSGTSAVAEMHCCVFDKSVKFVPELIVSLSETNSH